MAAWLRKPPSRCRDYRMAAPGALPKLIRSAQIPSTGLQRTAWGWDTDTEYQEARGNNGIAERLIIASGTAKKHWQNIAKKWDVSEEIKALQIEARRRGYGKGTARVREGREKYSQK